MKHTHDFDGLGSGSVKDGNWKVGESNATQAFKFGIAGWPGSAEFGEACQLLKSRTQVSREANRGFRRVLSQITDLRVGVSLGLWSLDEFPGRVSRNPHHVAVDLELVSTPCMKTGFIPQSSPPSGEIREREQAVETAFSTAC